MMTRKRRNATLKLAKGYWGSKSKHFKMAKQQVMKSGNYAFKGASVYVLSPLALVVAIIKLQTVAPALTKY